MQASVHVIGVSGAKNSFYELYYYGKNEGIFNFSSDIQGR